MRDALASAVAGLGTLAVTNNQNSADAVLDGVRQVMIYEAKSHHDVGWIASELEDHSDLRVVYISTHPWVSLNYQRARCMIAPIAPTGLNVTLLRRMVNELLEGG